MLSQSKTLISILLFLFSLDFAFAQSKKDWIGEYTTLAESITMDHYENNPQMSFNSKGVLLHNNKTNPVSICQYALMCFDRYKKTQDIRYYDKFMNQVKYLRDSTEYVYVNDTCIGYPYNFPFHDLKPNWYSGMSQAEAISVLVRYFSLSQDKTVLPLIVKLKNLMLLSVKEGGNLGRTPEGNIWIEEYPNSKRKAQVLNGYFIILVGLFEYCQLFPLDVEAKNKLAEGIASLKISVDKYDTGSWLLYDRTSGAMASNWYMKAQVLEMKHLYLLTQDDFFKRQMMLWSTYIDNHPISLPGCLITDHKFSTKIEKPQNDWYNASFHLPELLKQSSISALESNFETNQDKLIKLFDAKKQVSEEAKYDAKQVKGKRTPKIHFNLHEQVFIDNLSVSISDDKQFDIKNIKVRYMPANSSKYKKIKLQESYIYKNKQFFTFKEPAIIQAAEINFKIPNNQFEIYGINFHNSAQSSSTLFSHFYTDEIIIDQETFSIKLDHKKVKEVVVFYKFSATKEGLKTARWSGANSLYTNELSGIKTKAKYYQFLIVFDSPSNQSGVKTLEIY
jgi:hypothetical protein